MRQFARAVAVAVLSAGLAAAGTGLVTAPAEAKTWVGPAADLEVDPLADLEEFENRVLAGINDARVAAGLKPVRLFQSCVDGYSERWARHIKKTGVFAHRNQVTVLNGCELAWTGEALVRGIGLTPELAVDAWLDSPPHRAVIMKKRARWAGIGVRIDDQGRVIGVLNFGDPT
ncbi:MAG: CAP domain-containing protein [Nocardioides sp.]